MPLTPAQKSRLAIAIEDNNLEEMDAVLVSNLSRPVNPKLKDEVCFLLACTEGYNPVVIKYLENRGFDKNTFYCGLHEAIVGGNQQLVQILIEACELDPNAGLVSCELIEVNRQIEIKYSAESMFPLALAVTGLTNEHIAVVDYLAKLDNININNTFDVTTGKNITALQSAVKARNGKAVEILLRHHADPFISTLSADTNEPIFNAYEQAALYMEEGTREIAEQMYEFVKRNGLTIKLSKPSDEHVARTNARRDVMSDIRAFRHTEPTAVPSSSHSSGSDSPPRLTGSGSDSPASAGSTPPRKDSPDDSPIQTRLMEHRGVSPAAASSSHQAATHKPLSHYAAERLKREGTPDKALFFAAGSPFKDRYTIEVLKELCDLGLTFEEISGQRKNVFHGLVCSGRFDFLPYVIDRYRYCINSTNNDGQTALHIIMRGFENIDPIEREIHDTAVVDKVKYLLGIRVEIDAKDRFGNTALYYAEKTGYHRTAAYLIERGANPISSTETLPYVNNNTSKEKTKKAPKLPPPAAIYSAHSRSPTTLFNNKAPIVGASPAEPAPPPTQPATAATNTAGTVFLTPVRRPQDDEYDQKKNASKNPFRKLKNLISSGTSTQQARTVKQM